MPPQLLRLHYSSHFPSGLRGHTSPLPPPTPRFSCSILPDTPRPEKLVISGGCRLSGHVQISGSKNSALAILAATICSASGTSVIRGVPDVSDVRAMVAVLQSLGATVEVSEEGESDLAVAVDAAGVVRCEPSADAVRAIRAGFFVVGPLAARFGEAQMALPGGCRIGARPVDLHLSGLRCLGATVELRDEKVYVHSKDRKRLIGANIHLNYPSVGATETAMMAASVADGVTVVSNTAREPEVVDLAKFLIACGAEIKGEGTDMIVVSGKRKLHGAEFRVIPDRIEAGTFMIAAGITRSCISLSPVVPGHLGSLMDRLLAVGCRMANTNPSTIEVSAVPEKGSGFLRNCHLRTSPYPGFPTDLQPQFMALLTTCAGSSIVEELVFENRMNHVEQLKKLGAQIYLSGNTALVDGKCTENALLGSHVEAADLRSGASLVLAGMAARGETEVSGIIHIDRGYHNLDLKLNSLGAAIRKSAVF